MLGGLILAVVLMAIEKKHYFTLTAVVEGGGLLLIRFLNPHFLSQFHDWTC